MISVLLIVLVSALLRACNASFMNDLLTQFGAVSSLLEDLTPTKDSENTPKTMIFSEDPLVIYIPSFIAPEEAAQLVSLRFNSYSPF